MLLRMVLLARCMLLLLLSWSLSTLHKLPIVASIPTVDTLVITIGRITPWSHWYCRAVVAVEELFGKMIKPRSATAVRFYATGYVLCVAVVIGSMAHPCSHLGTVAYHYCNGSSAAVHV